MTPPSRWRSAGDGLRRGGRTRTALLLLAAALIAGLAGLAGLRGGLVEADAVDGEVSNVVLSSDAAGSLTIRWDAPTLPPTDYRLMWAPADQDYLSYRFENEALRGNSYPGGATTSLTLTGLTRGAEFNVRLRSRYRDGQYAQRRWSGPWTGEVTQRVRADAPAAPTALSATETTRKGQTSISLSWAAPDHSALTGYRVWRGAAADSLTLLVQDTGDTATGYNDTTTQPGTTYVYAVTALSLDGDSLRSATASVTRAAARTPRVDPTPEPTAAPTPEPTPQPGAIDSLTLSSDTRGALEMEWSAADPAPDRYWINWGESHLAFPSLEDRNFNFAWTGTDMYFGDSIVDAGKTYQVRVRAVYDRQGNKAAWNGPWSDTATQRVRSDPPQAPGTVSVGVVDHDGVSLGWSAPAHDALAGYRVLRGAGAASLGTLAELGVDARSYTDTATDGATTYHYAVVALSQDGDSPRSSTVAATTPPRTPVTPVVAGAPAAPAGLTGTLDGNGGVSLSWTDPGDSAISGYRVLRGADARSLVVIAGDTGSAALSYSDAAPAANATHVYAVQARNATGLSQLSATFSATTLSPPFGLDADAGAFDVALSWRAPDGDGITGYQVLRGDTADDMTVIAGDTGNTATSYVDVPVSPKTSYYYAVRARSAQGLGPASPGHLVTTAAAASLVFLDDEGLVSQQQQGSHTLVSNLARAANSGFGSIGNSAGFNSEQGVQVTTGRHPAGYTVSAVRARPHFIHGTGNTPSLKIHSDDNGKPGALLHTLTDHSNLAVGSTLEFTASPAITLQPRTKYWLMFANDANIHNNFFLLKSSSSLDEEPCGELDWSIGNGRYLRRNGTLFTSSLAPLAVAVVGSQVDDGSASELECTDTAAATTTYTKIGMGATVTGAQQGDIYSNDEDWYQVTLEADVEYQFDTFTAIFGFGYSASDGYIAGLYNSSGTAQTIETQHVGPSAGSQRRRAYFTPAAAGAYYLAVKPGSHGGPSGSVESAQDVPTYGVRVRKADDYLATTSTTGVVTVGGSVGGHFFAEHGSPSVSDTDWIRVALTAGARYRFTLTLHGATANMRATIVDVYNSSGTKVASGAHAGKYSVTAQSWYTPADNGDYYVALTISDRSGSDPWTPTPDYTLSVATD